MGVTIADIFAGIGGFSLGFHMAGFETAWACEIDKAARRIYSMRFPDVPLLGDIREITDPEPADVYCGGFPCQDLSLAGQRKGLSGERSGLFFEFVRLVEQTRPPWLVLENVPGLLSSNDGKDFAAVIRVLGDIGYGMAWRVFDAQFFGVPQRRRRVWIVGHIGDMRAAEVLFECEGVPGDPPARGKEGEDVAHAVTTRATDRLAAEDTYIVRENQRSELAQSPIANTITGPGGKGMQFVAQTLCGTHGNAASREINLVAYSLRRDPGGTGQGWNCNYVCKKVDPDRVRATPGVPRRVDGPRYRGLGNAVPVPVVAWIAERIMMLLQLEALEGEG